jgi:hypothetical protein
MLAARHQGGRLASAIVDREWILGYLNETLALLGQCDYETHFAQPIAVGRSSTGGCTTSKPS